MLALRTLTAAQATALDAELMSSAVGYRLDNLMELAGLSVACAIHTAYAPARYERVRLKAGTCSLVDPLRVLLLYLTRTTRPAAGVVALRAWKQWR